MTISLGMVTIDSTDAAALARWWARQLGREVADVGQGFFFMLAPAAGESGVVVGVQQVEQARVGKNRLHLDVTAADPAAEVARLLGEGAQHVADHAFPDFSWTVLADPDGNEFCVAPADAH